jgi:outer membrane protein TolC
MKDERNKAIGRSARTMVRAWARFFFILHPSSFILFFVCGCSLTPREVCDKVCDNVIMPEQRTIDYRDPAQLPPAQLPDTTSPRTVSDPRPEDPEWRLSLDDAIRISLENAKVIRVLAGVTAVSSGQTIYDAAITNTTIDQAQATFDPVLKQNNLWSRTNTPTAELNPFDFTRAFITSSPTDTYQSTLGATKTNVLGGQWALNWVDTLSRFSGSPFVASQQTLGGFPLNPQQTSTVELSYTQPLLQGGGYQVNTAPIVIARLNTETSYFQYKDSVQEMVRSVIEAYWELVQARTDVWARGIQVELSKFAFDLADAKLAVGLGNRSDEAQARVTYNQFRASLKAAQAAVLDREAALRNLLGLPPEDGRRIVPTSAPTTRRLAADWKPLVGLAEQRRPDIIELKLITEADRLRLLQAENQALPRVDVSALYRWNGLSGTMPNGESISTAPGQFTDWSVGINFSVPLGLRGERAKVRQQKLIVERDRANVDQSVHGAIFELAGAVRDMDSAYEQYLAFKETRIAADVNVKVQNERFKAGGVGQANFTYLNVLQALTDWGNAVTSEAQQLLLYNIALAALERRTGTILETHGLVFAEERFRAAGPLPLPCFDRAYPSAQPPVGAPERYPGTNEPSENVFDLKNPAPREPR